MIRTVVGIDGMACSMCESHVNDTVRRNFYVKSVKASHKKKQAEIISAEPLDEAALRNAIGDIGYTVTDVHTEPYKIKGLFGPKPPYTNKSPLDFV